jgi:hypothetical protein
MAESQLSELQNMRVLLEDARGLLSTPLPRSGPGASKRPITPIRAQRTPINRINKLKEVTGTSPVRRRTRPVTTAGEHISNGDPPANRGDPLYPGQE